MLLAELTGSAFHVAHMSARQSLRAVRKGKEAGVRVTCEVAPHHFTLTDEALATPMSVRHQHQDEPAAARGGRIATRCSQGIADGTRGRDRHRSRAAPLRREEGRVRPRAVRHRRPRDGRAAVARSARARRAASVCRRLIELLSVNPARIFSVPGGSARRRARRPTSPSWRRICACASTPQRCARGRRTRRSTAGSCAAAWRRRSSAAGRVFVNPSGDGQRVVGADFLTSMNTTDRDEIRDEGAQRTAGATAC